MQNSKYSKKVLFVGMPDMAIVCFQKLYSEGINIVGVVPPPKTDPAYEYFLSFLSNYSVNVIEYDKKMNEPDFIDRVRSLKADIAVVCSYNRLFPPELLRSTKDGFINCHPSLLPDYRGANPYSAVIINNEKYTGATLHFMDETFDTGDIIVQKKFELTGKETMGVLFNLFNYIFAEELVKVLTVYEQTGTLPRFKQKETSCKFAPQIPLDHVQNRIDWEKSAFEIDCFVRGLNPFIIAEAYFRNEHLRIMSTHFDKKQSNKPAGYVCDIKKGLGVATPCGTLYIDVLQYGSYFVTTGLELVERLKIKQGEFFQ